MFIDKELTFSDKQAVTASAASSNYYNQGTIADLGMSNALLMLGFYEDFAATGAATLTVSIQTDDNNTFSSPKTVSSQQYAIADLKAGKQYFLPLPIGTDEKYIRVFYTVATGPFTAGKITATIVDKPQYARTYAAQTGF